MHKVDYLSANWLIIDNNNKIVKRSLKYIKGVVYDFGCGVRPYEKDILEVANEYIGVDWGETLHGLKADIVSDLNKVLPIESKMADSIVSFQVMEHLCEPQVMLNEAYRILKNNGYVVLTVPFQWWIHEAPHDYYRYTPHGLKYMFEKSGFVGVKIKPNGGFFTMWFLKINYFSSRFVRGPKFMRLLIKAFLIPFWAINQILAPLLDRLDKNPVLESSGYIVIARKD